MKKLFAIVLLALSSLSGISQTTFDKIVKLNGEILEVSLKKMTEKEIEYTYPGEEMIQVIAKSAVEKILYKSGREEMVSSKVVIKGEEDWMKVIIVKSTSEVSGLTKITEVSGKQSKPFGQESKLQEKALELIKKEAAKNGAPIVLITEGSFSMSPINNYSYKGVAYKY